MGAYSFRRSAFVTVLLLAGGLTACGDDAAPTTTAATTTSEATTTTAAATTTSAVTTTSAAAPPVVALAPDGLLLVAANGSTTPLLFGAPQADVLAALEAVLGAPAEVGPGSAECPNGQDAAAAWPDTIQVGFSLGAFQSWTLRPDSTLADMTGIGIGSSRADVEASWTITVQDTSLGVEFFTAIDGSGYSGVLSDSSPSAVVTNLWAGHACIFR